MRLLTLFLINMTMACTAFTEFVKCSNPNLKRDKGQLLNHRNMFPLYAKKVIMGPLARAKKMMDPDDYNRVVEEKMRKSKMSREEAEADYNNFLENPPFYYALEKKEEYYKSLGYKDIFEGMIGEAEKEGKGDEMRERISKFRLRSKIKAYSVLIIAIVGLLWLQNIYNLDPENFVLSKGLPDYSWKH